FHAALASRAQDGVYLQCNVRVELALSVLLAQTLTSHRVPVVTRLQLIELRARQLGFTINPREITARLTILDLATAFEVITDAFLVGGGSATHARLIHETSTTLTFAVGAALLVELVGVDIPTIVRRLGRILSRRPHLTVDLT